MTSIETWTYAKMQDDNHTTIQEDRRNHEERTTQKEKEPQKNQSKMTIELYADRLLLPKLGPLLDAWQQDKKNLQQKDLVTVEKTL